MRSFPRPRARCATAGLRAYVRDNFICVFLLHADEVISYIQALGALLKRPHFEQEVELSGLVQFFWRGVPHS